MAEPSGNREIVELRTALGEVRARLSEAQRQLEEANSTLHAIQHGAVDAVVAIDPQTGQTRVLNLKGSEHPYRVFVEAVAEGALTVNQDGVAIFCNHTFAHMLRTVPGKILGHRIGEFFAPFEKVAVDELLRAGAREKLQQEIALQAADGTLLQVQLSVAPVRTEELEGICILATDLSEKHRTAAALRRALERARLVEELRRALELRDEFLSIASHELKTPVTSLLLRLQMARRLLDSAHSLPEFARFGKAVDVSIRQARRMITLIEDLLDVSQIQAGRLRLHPEETNLTRVVEDVLEQFQHECDEFGCECVLEAEVSGFWDPLRVEQVVINLLSNAFKYGAGRPVSIKLECSGGAAVLEVRDRGEGIPEREQKRIFGIFERAVPATKIGGFGLGLYISKQIVESHGGFIRVKSTPGAGTIFRVELPLRGRAELAS